MASDVDAWRDWFAQNVKPELDKLPLLAKPCPCCGLDIAEEGTSCGYCFICHGRGYCEDDGAICCPRTSAEEVDRG